MIHLSKILFLVFISVFAVISLGNGAEETSEHSATQAGAEEHTEHHETPLQIAGKWINFAVLVALLYFFLTRSLRIQDRFREDYQAIQTSIESARQAKEEAERKLKELDEKLGGLNQEIARIKAEASREADEEKRKILESAQKEAERIVALAHREIDTEVEVARRTLRKQVADVSISRGQKIIETEMNEEDQKRLLEDYIKEFGK